MPKRGKVLTIALFHLCFASSELETKYDLVYVVMCIVKARNLPRTVRAPMHAFVRQVRLIRGERAGVAKCHAPILETVIPPHELLVIDAGSAELCELQLADILVRLRANEIYTHRFYAHITEAGSVLRRKRNVKRGRPIVQQSVEGSLVAVRAHKIDALPIVVRPCIALKACRGFCHGLPFGFEQRQTLFAVCCEDALVIYNTRRVLEVVLALLHSPEHQNTRP
jgi:hypothetical protein